MFSAAVVAGFVGWGCCEVERSSPAGDIGCVDGAEVPPPVIDVVLGLGDAILSTQR